MTQQECHQKKARKIFMADKPSLLAQLHPNPKLEKLRNEKIKITTQKEKAEVKLTQSGHRVTQAENEIETDKKKARTARM